MPVDKALPGITSQALCGADLETVTECYGYLLGMEFDDVILWCFFHEIRKNSW